MKSDIGHKIPGISCVITDIKNSIHIPNLRSLKFESRSHEYSESRSHEYSGSAYFQKFFIYDLIILIFELIYAFLN